MAADAVHAGGRKAFALGVGVEAVKLADELLGAVTGHGRQELVLLERQQPVEPRTRSVEQAGDARRKPGDQNGAPQA